METTFISIHDVSPDARILYTSDSVVDILGYIPDELVNRSAWDFFPQDEVANAQMFHQQRIASDKAAVLVYCRIKSKSGEWIGCECVFSTVYDAMVVCTSVFHGSESSRRRLKEAPIVRRIFSSSPRDPRYHMLSHLSTRFNPPTPNQSHEPRAALFLNRFTRTLSIMYATSAIEQIIGISADVIRGKSFYCCIAENCLQDAVSCLENAKGNDSIAYLRFWFRDPRSEDQQQSTDDDTDSGVGVNSNEETAHPTPETVDPIASEEFRSPPSDSPDNMDIDNQRNSSADSGLDIETNEAIFGQARRTASSRSSATPSFRTSTLVNDPIELEAVISCTSDGLVVCLRKAKPYMTLPDELSPSPVENKGIFAAPWAVEPMMPPVEMRARANPRSNQTLKQAGPATAHARGPPVHDFMTAIREQAVFAWALTGINGTLGRYSHGTPSGESLPVDGLAIWASDPQYLASVDKLGQGKGLFQDPKSHSFHSAQKIEGAGDDSSMRE
ncbi:Hypothetical protein R9X50_00160000 [Acrodontium crateriforme]|uniref:PAS domain-containing protein n=1 Tax=Acrodontium crateriforme TaxID=150365 RepID=A0AAQ3M107_9PEZI|nr:Hypothetical protein R9X50_00160000 [Acrodontium crateriforme]